ncbi:MAG: T9SS type A sorting domain-containing protein [Flavobacteriales bacterium]
MRKILFTAMSFLFCGMTLLSAQTLDEGFEGVLFPPNDWTVYNFGSTSEWHKFNGIGHSGLAGARIIGGTFTNHDDWIIAPKLTITSTTDSIHFWAENSSTSSTVNFRPRVSTSSKDTVDFTDFLSPVVVPGSGWTRFSYGLGAYNGQDIYFGLHTNSSGGANLHIDDFEGPTLFVPTCPTISMLDTNNLTSSSVEVVWDSVSNAEQYTYYLFNDGEGPGGVPIDSGSTVDTMVTINNLPFATDLEVWIVTDCGVVDSLSEIDGPITFTTPCGVIEDDYYQNFDDYLPNCWTERRGQLTDSTVFSSLFFSDWTEDGFLNNGFTGSAKSFISGTNHFEWLITPSLNLDSIPNSQISFFTGITQSWNPLPLTGGMGTDDKIRVVISTDDGITWADTNVLLAYDSTNIPSHLGDYIAISLDDYSGIVKIGFYVESTVWNSFASFFVDDFKWGVKPDCDIVTSITTDSVTVNSGYVSWDTTTFATQFIVEFDTAGFVLGTGTQIIVSGLDTMISGLDPQTEYEVYVTPICSATDTGDALLSTVFTTDCAPRVSYYVENFNTFIPQCWSETNGPLLAVSTPVATTSTWAGDGFLNVGSTGSARVNYSSGPWTDEWLVSEAIDLDSMDYAQIEFDAGITQSFSTFPDEMNPNDRLVLLVSHDDGVTWLESEALFTITPNNQPISVSPGTHYEVPVTHLSGVVKFAFFAKSNGGGGSYNFYIDNFELSEAPSCLPVTNYTQINIGDTLAEISWDNLSGAADFIIEYGEAGFDLGTGMTTTTTSTSITITGLSELTTYDFYVRPVCSSTDSAQFMNWTTFTTECLTHSTSYNQNFTTYLPNCWTEAQGELLATSSLVGTSSNWTSDGYLNSGSAGAARSRISGTDSYNWIISPTIFLGTDLKQISFDAGATALTSSNAITMPSDDKYMVVVSTDDGATWSEANKIIEFNQSFQPTHTGNNYTLSLASFVNAGNIKVGFYTHSEIANTSYQVYLDNFVFEDLDTTAADLVASGINAPDVICTGDMDELEVMIYNNGFIPVPFYPINVEIEDASGTIVYSNTSSQTTNIAKETTDTIVETTLDFLTPGTYKIISTVNASGDVNPINNKFTKEIIVSDFPNVYGGADVSICQGESVVLNASGAVSYVWNGAMPNGVEVFPSVTTDYIVAGTNSAGCEAYDTITVDVEVNLPPTIQYVNQTLLTVELYASYEWSFGGVVVGTNSTHFATANGVYTLKAITFSGCEVTNNHLVSTVGVDEISDFNIEVYPNPVKDVLTVEFKSDVQITQLSIFDMQSRRVKSFTEGSNKLDVSNLSQGIYILYGEIDGKAFQHKFTKQ